MNEDMRLFERSFKDLGARITSVGQNYTSTVLVIAANLFIPDHPELLSIPAMVAGSINNSYSSYGFARNLGHSKLSSFKYGLTQGALNFYKDMVVNGAMQGNGFVYQVPIIVGSEVLRLNSKQNMESLPVKSSNSAFKSLDDLNNWSMADLEREG